MAEVIEGEVVSPSALARVESSVVVIKNAALDVDVMALLLADKRSEHTRRSYAKTWAHFFGGSKALSPVYVENPTSAARVFCSWPRAQIAVELTLYKQRMIDAQLTEATINHHLAAMRSLLAFAWKLGISETDGRGLVDGEKVKSYRDTRGIDVAQMKRLLALPAKKFPDKKLAPDATPRQQAAAKKRKVRRLRDEAMLRLLCENGIRNDSLVRCDVRDFDLGSRTLSIYSKGHGTQQRRITLSAAVCEAIEAYVRSSGHTRDRNGPLFRNLDHRPDFADERLSNDGLRWLVEQYGAAMGVPTLRPHKLRHSAITALLDATGGDVRAVQKFSGHAKIDTLLIYDDNREDKQGELTGVLSGLLSDKPAKRKTK